jgi:hypothetical protein
MFVIQREADGKYVAPPGRDKSYTERLEEAWVFITRATAQKHCCAGNERVVPLLSLLLEPEY